MSDLRWAHRDIPPKYGTEHFLVVGASGSGKTTIINMMLRSLFTSGRKFRGVVYDPKQEIIPYLSWLGQYRKKGNLKILDPFDTRSWLFL